MADLPFGKVTDKFHARFTIGILVPCLVFSTLGTAVLVLGHGTRTSLARWKDLGAAGQSLLAAAVIGGAMLLAWVLAGQTAGLIRTAAGHASGRLSRTLMGFGLRRHRTVHDRLTRDAAASSAARERLYTDYPNHIDDVQPTRLGNALAATEAYARTRYGIDLVLVWPRLYSVLPDKAAASVATARAEVELQLVTSTLASLFAVGITIPMALLGAPLWAVIVWPAGCLLVGLAAYRSAVSAATAYGEEIRCALDLHRGELLTALGLDTTADLTERDKWQRLAELWFHSLPLDAARPVPEPDVPSQARQRRTATTWWHRR